jgi:hypothetical protein
MSSADSPSSADSLSSADSAQVFLMLSNDAAVQEVVAELAKSVAGDASDRDLSNAHSCILVDCSTVSPETTEHMSHVGAEVRELSVCRPKHSGGAARSPTDVRTHSTQLGAAYVASPVLGR